MQGGNTAEMQNRGSCQSAIPTARVWSLQGLPPPPEAMPGGSLVIQVPSRNLRDHGAEMLRIANDLLLADKRELLPVCTCLEIKRSGLLQKRDEST